MGKNSLIEIAIRMSLSLLSITGVFVFKADLHADQQWEKYYDGTRSTFYYDKKSLHYPYKDNNKIIAAWTKNIPSIYLSHNQESIGYFSDLIYIDCEKIKYRRTEMLIYNDSDELIMRQMGRPTYYTIDSGSEAEALLQEVCP